MEEFDKKTFNSFIYWSDKTLKTVDKVLNPVRFKKILFAALLLILFIILQNKIILFIENNLLLSPDFSNFLLDIILILISILIDLFILLKLIKNKYRPNYNEIFISLLFFIVITYYCFTGKWRILSIDLYLFKLQYVYLIIIPLILFLLLPLIVKHLTEKQVANRNFYLGDDPIHNIEDDKLDSRKVGEKLVEILKNENHTYSFTIGLVGPWGNGKSSVINFVKNNLDKSTDAIVFQFLPYLNHTENDIINEFFILLSGELEKYSGKVASQIMLYSKKLTTLYKDKNIFDFLEDHINKIDSTSANKLYNEINHRLVEINKKIIVLVDDLDRLNEKEILQVLKLIRNTANFKNTMFVISMDKEYILHRLKNNNDILNSAFIDKFFQLEVYLPEIDKTILRNVFLDLLQNSALSSDIGFKPELSDAMLSDENLFNDYIKNIRDIKRVVNQLIYDYPVFKNEINFKDFLNFIYFKLKYPKYLKILNDNKADFIEIDNVTGNYGLITVEDSTSTAFNYDNLFNNKTALDYSFLKKYKLYQIDGSNNSIQTDKSLSNDDKVLLMKTLAFLFGSQNTVNNGTSIKNVNNFQMLMQQRIFKEFLTLREFELLFDDVNLKLVLSNLYSENKISQLINRLKFFNKVHLEKIKKGLIICVNLYDDRIKYDLNEAEILFLINKFADKVLQADDINDKDQLLPTEWLKKNLFESNDFLIESRLFLLGHLFKSKDLNNLWYLPKNYIEEQVLHLFSTYLNNSSWDVNDYNVYSLYHVIKIVNVKKVNELFISHWNLGNIELLCAQTIELDSFRINLFKISDFVIDIFESKNKFLQFVSKFENNKKEGFIEILNFYEISSITDHTNNIVFSFTKSKLMTAKIKFYTQRSENLIRKLEEKVSQVFFETNSRNLAAKLLHNLDLTNSNIKTYSYEDNEDNTVVKFYVEILLLDRLVSRDDILKISNKILDVIYKENFAQITQLDSTKLFTYNNFTSQNTDDTYIKLFSVQPKLID